MLLEVLQIEECLLVEDAVDNDESVRVPDVEVSHRCELVESCGVENFQSHGHFRESKKISIIMDNRKDQLKYETGSGNGNSYSMSFTYKSSIVGL